MQLSTLTLRYCLLLTTLTQLIIELILSDEFSEFLNEKDYKVETTQVLTHRDVMALNPGMDVIKV